jgi:hypothetical protein
MQARSRSDAAALSSRQRRRRRRAPAANYSSPSSTLYDNSLITAGAAPAAKGEL